MEHINSIKTGALSVIGVIGSYVTTLFGGWDAALVTLIIFMTIDYLTGLMVAGVFKKSTKSKNGALESRAGFKGLCRKGMILLIVLIATRLDIMVGSTFIRNAVIIGYVANEAISIIENAGLMGIPIHPALRKGIDALSSKEDK